MGPYGLICSCPFGYNAFFSSLNLIFYLFCEKFLRNCVKDNEKKKKKQITVQLHKHTSSSTCSRRTENGTDSS